MSLFFCGHRDRHECVLRQAPSKDTLGLPIRGHARARFSKLLRVGLYPEPPQQKEDDHHASIDPSVRGLRTVPS